MRATQLLEKAFAEASNLPEAEQDILARWLLDELASRGRWEEMFSKSRDRLDELANEALDEHMNKRTRRLRLDDL